MQQIIKLSLPPMDQNCYIIPDGNGKCVIIDPGAAFELIDGELKKQNLIPEKILLTHGHFDHTSAAEEIKKSYGARLYIHENDECMLSDREKSGALIATFFPFNPTKAEEYVKQGDIITQGELEIKVMETPGHSRGSVCYIYEDVIFAGDTLFKGSVGRTDLYMGDYRQLDKSLEKLASLSGDYTVLCGHGEDTSLEWERKFNPYILR